MPRMIRSICAAAVAAGALSCNGGAMAQSAVLYGLLDASASRVKPVGLDTHALQLDNGNMSRSFVGVRGSEDLGGGLRAVFRFESYLRVDVGAAGRADGDAFWGREASVGLSGSFGTTVLGRTPSPLWLLDDQLQSVRRVDRLLAGVRQYFGGAVLRRHALEQRHLVHQQSARSAARRLLGQRRRDDAGRLERPQPAASASPTSPARSRRRWSPRASATAPSRCPRASSARPCCRRGATYDFQFVRVYGLIGRIKTEANVDGRNTSFQLGAAVPVGTGLILFAYGRAHDSTPMKATTDRTVSIGYDYFLSKATDLYVAAMYERQSFVSSGSAIAGGLRVRF